MKNKKFANMNSLKKKITKKQKEDLDFDGSWDAHNCCIERCEWCEENPENCKCSDNGRE